ncbi:MAG: glycosyltransferase family 4 protein [Acidobacteriota bacterium]|nr:glycosyltransferase family 4 protein [Acidobacteriota bacterium]
MKLLMGMPASDSLGGPAACEPPFIEELRKMGVQVAEETYVYGDKLTKMTFSGRSKRVLGAIGRLRRHAKSEELDLIHLNTSFDSRALLRDALAVSILSASHLPIFLKFHGSDPNLLLSKNIELRILQKRLFSRAAGIGVLSSEEKQNFIKAGLPENKVFLVKNAVCAGTAAVDSKFRQSLNVAAATPLLLFIARLIPAKGLFDVVKACGILRNLSFDFRLLCVGDGPERADAEALVARHHLQSWVRFFGYIPERETRKFYANSTMLLFPTYHIEGFPMVIFNAAANGLPIITTRIRAAADYLREPDNCYWVEAKNPEMLAEKIIKLINDTELRSAMGLKNRALAQRFSANTVAPEYVSIYRQLIASKENTSNT